MKIGNREGVVANYKNLGLCFQSLCNHVMAEEYLKKALLLNRNIGHNLNEFQCLCRLSSLKVSQSHLEEASSYLFQSIKKFDTLRNSLNDND